MSVRLALDNGGPFVSPAGLGEVVRVCLHQRITPVFIPPREPSRNGMIEHFSDTFDRRFFGSKRFSCLAHLIERAGAFERFHKSQHRYSYTNGRTQQESASSKPRRQPLPAAKIPSGWPKRGCVELVRFIRSNLRLRVLGRSIPMPDGIACQYVIATLDLSRTTADNLLVTDIDGQLLTTAQLPAARR